MQFGGEGLTSNSRAGQSERLTDMSSLQIISVENGERPCCGYK